MEGTDESGEVETVESEDETGEIVPPKATKHNQTTKPQHSPPNMNNNSKKLIQPIRVARPIRSIEQPQLEGEGDAVGELDVFAEVFLVFEAFEVEGEDVGEFFYFHPTHASP